MTKQQGVIELKVRRDIILLEEPQIARLSNEQAAINLTISQSGLHEGVIADELGMDHGQFSRIKSGTAHFPARFGDLYDVCGSEAHLQYLNYSRGYEAIPRRRKSEVEIELERTRYELEQERMKTRILTEAINGAGR